MSILAGLVPVVAGCSSHASASDSDAAAPSEGGAPTSPSGSSIQANVHFDFAAMGTATAFDQNIQLNEDDAGAIAILTGNNVNDGKTSILSITIPAQAPGSYACGFDNPSTDASMYYQPDQESMGEGYFSPQDDGHDNFCSVVITEYDAHVRGTFTAHLDIFNGSDSTYQFSEGTFDIVRWETETEPMKRTYREFDAAFAMSSPTVAHLTSKMLLCAAAAEEKMKRPS